MSIIINIPQLKKPDRCLECPLDFYICPHQGVLENCPIQDVPKGTWTFDPLAGDWVCSECDLHSMEHGKYCPNCGAQMEG
ncbi:MAG: hypothetical protein J6T10_32140 [Methanobrevibacter sp.]|nr:hypothetical protein [Methanobrevibacter sp.]